MKSVIRNLRTKSFVKGRYFMVYGYGKLLQIFHITAMLLGILMEKISRVQAAGRNWTGSCAAYASARKGAGTCYKWYAGGNGHAGVNADGYRTENTGRMTGNKYRDRRLLKITQRNEPEIRSVKKKRHRIRDWPDSVSAEKSGYRAA